MPISITVLGVVTAAALAAVTPAGAPAVTPAATVPQTVAPVPTLSLSSANPQPAWRAIRDDTLSDLILTTETLGGRVRFVARGVKVSTPVTTADFTTDSVRVWIASAIALASNAKAKMGDMRGLGEALTLNVTTATTGEPAYGFYVGDAVSDQQLALALTKASVTKLTSGLTSAMDAISH